MTNKALLVLPRLRVQNANAISSPLTWGFPAVTAFTGLMTALERRVAEDVGAFYGVGVICHSFEPQVTEGFTKNFRLTRNPVLKDGNTAAIVEEGRAHLDVTLVFEVELSSRLGDTERAQLAAHLGEVVAGMRVAGGSVIEAQRRPELVLVSDDPEEARRDFRRLSRRWLPGFALVSRDDLLEARFTELRATAPESTRLDAWLDLSRLNYRVGDQIDDSAEWVADPRIGWTVPIPVGFAALSELHPPGTVVAARDPRVPFRFVETVYSMGQWISPHRLGGVRDLLWEPSFDPVAGLYRCVNAFNSNIISNQKGPE